MRSADFIKDLSWSASLASSAFLDAVHVGEQLRELHYGQRWHHAKVKENNTSSEAFVGPSPGCPEFVAALAAGIGSNLILSVGSTYPLSTLALAAAAKSVGGKLVSVQWSRRRKSDIDTERLVRSFGLSEHVQFLYGVDWLTDGGQVVYAPDFVWIGFDMKGHYDTLCGKLQVNRNGCLIVEDDFSEHGSSPFKQHFLRKNPNKRLFKLRTWFSPIGTGLHITRLAPATQPLLSSPSPAS
eukprot:TRINITY_DN185_c0_g1_i1.p1 TRINITY_DN185_c0_g1~~TRINITY_DN185_c0_g1_i1.p1  ORF type:complete len:240 (-),score=40.74 TRINITY_DN185_c0_g1_i1:412-1131(-)